MYNRFSENNFEKNEIKVLTSELPKCYHVVNLIERGVKQNDSKRKRKT
jgi:hypothetical protein